MTYGIKGSGGSFGKYGSGYVFEGNLNPAGGTMPIAFNFLNGVDSYLIPGQPPTTVDLAMLLDQQIVSIAVSLDPTTGIPIYTPKVIATLGNDYSIQLGDVTGSTTPQFHTHFKWDVIEPTNRPDASKGEDYDL